MDRYRLGSTIETQPFSTLYDAIKKQSEKPRIIKKVYALTPGINAILLQQDIKTLTKLKHPNIVRYHDCFISDDDLFIVMDLFDNISLRDFLKKQTFPLSEDLVRNILKQIIRGLLFLHENNVFHGHLNALNVLLSKENSVKIIDFGLSRSLELEAQSSFAPEIVQGHEASFSSDVWGLGLILYELLTFKQAPPEQSIPPYLDTNIEIVLSPISGTFSAELISALHLMLQKDTSKRINLNHLHRVLFGDINALFEVGCDYEMGRNGKPINPELSQKFYKEATDQGHSDALYKFGFGFTNGLWGKPNLPFAGEFFKKSKDLGNPNGISGYGWCLGNGIRWSKTQKMQ